MRTISVWSRDQPSLSFTHIADNLLQGSRDMSHSLFVQITSLLQKVRGPDGTPETEVFLKVCRHIIPVIGMLASKESPMYQKRNSGVPPDLKLRSQTSLAPAFS